jgi:hypothetical protein
MRQRHSWVLAAILVGASVGCYGFSSEEGTPAVRPIVEAEPAMFPRLSHTQWENTVRDLLRLPALPGYAATFTSDPPGATFDTNVSKMSVTPGLFVDYQRAADELALKVVSDPAALARILPPNLPTDPTQKARAFITAFGKRAFRRPLQTAEIDAYATLFTQGTTLTQTKDPFAAGVQLTITAMLQSPHFIYHEEIGGTTAVDGRIPLTEYETATKLSYALWNTMPDDELFTAAEDGSLKSSSGIAARAKKMVDDPRAASALMSFHSTIFKLSLYPDVSKNTSDFPKWNAQVATSMKKEAELFLQDVVVTRSQSLRELLTAPYSFVNADLAWIYGLSGNFGANFVRTDLDPKQRAGILTQVGFLAKNGGQREPDTIHRGVFINLHLLCANLPPPPGMIPPLPPADGRTNRERVNSHTGPGTCGAGCHGGMINPIGYAYEHYDAIGRYQTMDNGQPIDSSAEYKFSDGTIGYADAVELANVLATRPQTHQCYASSWLEYVYGRTPTSADDALVADVAQGSLGGSSVKELIVKLVTSPRFLSRLEVR